MSSHGKTNTSMAKSQTAAATKSSWLSKQVIKDINQKLYLELALEYGHSCQDSFEVAHWAVNEIVKAYEDNIKEKRIAVKRVPHATKSVL